MIPWPWENTPVGGTNKLKSEKWRIGVPEGQSRKEVGQRRKEKKKDEDPAGQKEERGLYSLLLTRKHLITLRECVCIFFLYDKVFSVSDGDQPAPECPLMDFKNMVLQVCLYEIPKANTMSEILTLRSIVMSGKYMETSIKNYL